MESGRTIRPQSWNRYAYVLNNPLRLIDPTGLMDEDEQEKKKKEQPPPPPTPANVVIEVGKLKTYNGEPRVFPDDSSDPDEKLYGIGRINTIKVVDNDGKPIDPSSGVTIEEKVELQSAEPKDAAKIGSKNANDKPLPLEEGGVRYDTVGILTPDPGTNKLLKELPSFTVVDKQTLTVKTADGTPVLRVVNTITYTNTDVKYDVGKVEVIKPKKP